MTILDKLRTGLAIAPALFFLLLAARNAPAQELRIAAAADLKFAMQELAQSFEKQTQTKVSVMYGSSGSFFAQIQNGAPFDLFLSADMAYPEKLQAAGVGEVGSLYEYAVGRMVIWIPADMKIDLRTMRWSALLEARIQRIAIANPKHAPYGRAAVAALQKAGIYEQVKSKLVYGEDISQAMQFVQSGNAQAGMVARSLALSPELSDGQIWEVPAEMHPPIQQAALVLKNAKNKEAALKFLEFMKGPSGRRILENHGFSAPQSAAPQAGSR